MIKLTDKGTKQLKDLRDLHTKASETKRLIDTTITVIIQRGELPKEEYTQLLKNLYPYLETIKSDLDCLIYKTLGE